MWKSRTKTDLIIEVWEALDCESVGAKEINEIVKALREELGESAVDPPMTIARLLADEGAYLRHSEIMKLHIEQFEDSEYAAIFRNLIQLDNLKQANSTIRNLENLRRKFGGDGDQKGLRLLKEKALSAKKQSLEIYENKRFDAAKRLENKEIADWLTLWLQTPEMFESWVLLRQKSPDFKKKFSNDSE